MKITYGNEPIPASVRALGPDHTEITVHIGAEDQAALGMESGVLLDWFLTALRGLAALRTGAVDQETPAGGIERNPATVDTWYWVINDLDEHLLPALHGIRNAAIRAHAAAGGSVGNLSLAMGVAKSTAQTRREALLSEPPTEREAWASRHAGEFAERADRRSMTQYQD